MAALNKKSRGSETRSNQTRKKAWVRPSRLDTPPAPQI